MHIALMQRGVRKMATNRGKQFEDVVRHCFEQVPNTSVIRLPDPTNGYLGIRNISDFVIYNYPHQYFIECKSVHGNLLPFSNITDNQWNGMLEESKKKGVIAGVICWWVDKDVTKFIPIGLLQKMKDHGGKSIRYDILAGCGYCTTEIKGQKKRVFFEYDMANFFEEVTKWQN